MIKEKKISGKEKKYSKKKYISIKRPTSSST